MSAPRHVGRLVPVVLTVAVTVGACATTGARDRAGARPSAPAEAVVQPPVWVKTASGIAELDPASGVTRFAVAGGVAAPDWSALVSATPLATGTRVASLDPATGAERAAAVVPGSWSVNAVSARGRRVALTSTPVAAGPGAVGRSATDLMVVSPDGTMPARSFHLTGNLAPDAFASDAQGLYLLDYLPAEHPDRYRVRFLDLPLGTVQDVFTREKTPAEEMHGQSRTQLAAPDASTLYTLYTEAATEVGHAFIHTLSLDGGWVHCIDLPPELGFAAQGSAMQGAEALSPDGATIYVVGPAGRVAIVDTTSLAVQRTVALPGPTAPLAVRPAIAAGPGAVWVARGNQLVRLSATGLGPTTSVMLQYPVTGLAGSLDGKRLVVTSPGRLSILDARTGATQLDRPVRALAGVPVDRVRAG